MEGPFPPILLGTYASSMCLSRQQSAARATCADARFGADCADGWSARLTSAEGTVEVRRAQETDWSPVRRDDVFCAGDSIRVLGYSRASVALPGETANRLDENTTITFLPPAEQKRSWLEVLRGVLHIISRDPAAVGVQTPFANAGIEGTEFLVVVTDVEATITVFEGTVTLSNSAGEVSVGSGQRVSARMGQLPIAQAVVRPRDAVQWTLYYSPVLDGPLPRKRTRPRRNAPAIRCFTSAAPRGGSASDEWMRLAPTSRRRCRSTRTTSRRSRYSRSSH